MAALPLGSGHDRGAFESRNRLALVVVVAGLALLGARLVSLQVLRGAHFEHYAAIERVSKVRATASRGQIVGRGGEVLARNIESHRVEVMPHRVTPERLGPLLAELRRLLDLTDAEVQGLAAELRRAEGIAAPAPIVVRRDLVSSHCPYDSHALELVGPLPYRSCQTCGRSYEPPPARPSCPGDRKKLVPSGNGGGSHCPTCAREFSDAAHCPYDDSVLRTREHMLRCPMCGRGFDDEVALLRSNAHLLPEIRVRTEIQREYPLRFLASHVLGYTGRVNDRDLRPLAPGGEARFSLDDRVGRTGLEAALDALLRGVDGEEILVRRSGSEGRSDMPELVDAFAPRPTIAGLHVRLTMDLDLQRDAKVAMAHVQSGAVVAIEARTGKILVLYSKPSFDPNIWSGRLTAARKSEVDSSPYAPLIHKAVHPFPPASVFKVVSAAAALERGVVTPRTTLHCPGAYEFGGRRFRCHKHEGHGDVTLHDALVQSCDVYFYKVGEALGIDTLAEQAARMGFGEPTGVELAESEGLLPTKAWYDKHYGRYFPGYALSTAVGQKDVTATPLQVARAYAALAVGGVLPPLTLIEQFETGGQAVAPLRPLAARSIGLKPATMQILRRALEGVVDDASGTGTRAAVPGVRVAGKTGTAEAAQRARDDAPPDVRQWLLQDHAWFAAWAPAEAPEIVVVAFVEHGGGGGQVAAPIVGKVLARYFGRRAGPSGAGVAPPPAATPSGPP